VGVNDSGSDVFDRRITPDGNAGSADVSAECVNPHPFGDGKQAAATSCATPDTGPCFAKNARARCVGDFRTAIPAPSMIDIAFAGSASAVVWT